MIRTLYDARGRALKAIMTQVESLGLGPDDVNVIRTAVRVELDRFAHYCQGYVDARLDT